jgi:hypothetical protein
MLHAMEATTGRAHEGFAIIFGRGRGLGPSREGAPPPSSWPPNAFADWEPLEGDWGPVCPLLTGIVFLFPRDLSPREEREARTHLGQWFPDSPIRSQQAREDILILPPGLTWGQGHTASRFCDAGRALARVLGLGDGDVLVLDALCDVASDSGVPLVRRMR